MGNFKVKVNNEAESREAQELLKSIGYHRPYNNFSLFSGWVCFNEKKEILCVCDSQAGEEVNVFKEITLAELRDMVVLKRNDVNDATHESPIFKYFKACDDWYYFDLGCTDKWQKSAGAKPEYYEKLKPIEKKEMKEYLQGRPDGTCVHKIGSGDAPEEWIEIPEGAEIAIQFKNNPNEHGVVFYKNNGKSCFGQNDKYWQNDADWTMDQLLNENYHDGDINLSHWILWQRTPSLNDQYAEIEQVRQAIKAASGNDSNHTADAMAYAFMGVGRDKVRQHRHYFIGVSDVDEIDFYEIALRYNVTDPCIQHILKKCLAVGQRGQKDFHHDLKDIYDTAKRMLDVHGLDS